MNIDVYTVCWNEMAIIPFCIDYWKRFARHVYVFDNGSTDGSVEYLKQYDWITVQPFGNKDCKQNLENSRIKNEKWKGSDADYVVCCDIDELIIGNNIKEKFEECKKAGCTIIEFDWLWLAGGDNPKYQEGKYLHELCPNVIYNLGKKTMVFSPKDIKEMKYTPGAHECKPSGNVKKTYLKDIFCYHINNSLSLEYKINRYKLQNKRLSQEDKKKRWGVHYGYSETKIKEAYNEGFKKARNINEFLKSPKNVYVWYNGVKSASSDLTKYIKEKSPIIEDKEFSKYLMSDYALNNHHFYLSYHYDVVIPRILNEAGAKFDKNDFNVVPYKDGKHDLSYLYPKKSHEYSIDVFVNGVKNHFNGDYSNLINIDRHFTKSANNTGYHKLFIASHSIFHMKNKTIGASAPKMLILGDSQMIPDIPVLCHYCKELVYFDVRCNINGLKTLYKDFNYDVCVVEFYNDKPLSMYQKFNEII